MIILEGKRVAAHRGAQLQENLEKMKAAGICPELAILLIGDDKPSAMYAKSMQKRAASVGLRAEIHAIDGTTDQAEVLALIEALNANQSVYGILPMMPLPDGFDADAIVNAIAPEKDVDGLSDKNIARLFSGKASLVPCTPKAVMAILDDYGIELKGKRVVIVGRSNVVGKPLFQLCLNRHATVTVCHSRTVDLGAVTREADVVISATGKAHLIQKGMIRPGAVVIDVGINRENGKTIGDVDYDDLTDTAGAMTPVPGGVGVVTTMMVLENVVAKW